MLNHDWLKIFNYLYDLKMNIKVKHEQYITLKLEHVCKKKIIILNILFLSWIYSYWYYQYGKIFHTFILYFTQMHYRERWILIIQVNMLTSLEYKNKQRKLFLNLASSLPCTQFWNWIPFIFSSQVFFKSIGVKIYQVIC